MPRQMAPDPGFEEENRRRSQVTVAELIDQARAEGQTDFTYPSEPLDLDAVIERIGPERWQQLRERRDRILGRLREGEEG
jgi:hypothetical protein